MLLRTSFIIQFKSVVYSNKPRNIFGTQIEKMNLKTILIAIVTFIHSYIHVSAEYGEPTGKLPVELSKIVY